MTALLLLFGMTPWQPALDTAPSGPAATHAALPIGAPAPHLDHDVHAATRLMNTSRWRAFADDWGPGFAARFDPRTHAPRFVYVPGVDEALAPALVEDLCWLAGVDPAELEASKPRTRGDRTWLRYTRRWRGVPVEGDDVLVAVQQGRIHGVWVRLSPVRALPSPRPGEVVLPLSSEDGSRVVSHLVTRTEAHDVVRYTDRSGRVVHQYSTRHPAELQVAHLERTIGDDHVASAARQLDIADLAGTTDTTLDDGSHGLLGELLVSLDGPALQVRRDGREQEAVSVVPDDDGLAVFSGGDEVSEATASVLHHTHTTFDWLAGRWPDHPWLGEKVWADVDISSSACNAYYTSGTINFFVGYGSYCYNYGQVADVIHHEIGHGIHHYILAGGTFAGDVSEGSADYVSATIQDDPVVGKNSKPGGGYVRELDTDRVYPDDVTGGVHNDGLIWGSFLWNLREQWQADYGEDAGAELVDLLFLGALESGPTLTDLHEAVILADDDNGDLSDGTPHACELVTLLDQHGLGPGPLGVVVLDHEPLGPQASDDDAYEVVVDVFSPTSACRLFDPDAPRLFMATGPRPPVPGTPGADASALDAWTELPLSRTDSTYTAAIPRQLATTQVHYFFEVQSADGEETLWSHGGDESGVYSFRVGNREAVWCEDFEGGEPADWTHGGGLPWAPDASLVDQWAVAEPLGEAAFSPVTAWSGTQVMGTDPNGAYVPNNQQYLSTAPIAVPDGRMVLLTLQRFLTVEDGVYDQARMYVDDVEVYANGVGAGGEHVLDADWTAVELEADPLRSGPLADGEASLHFTLESDPGLEFGGWAIDDVCVERLADIPAHYRRMGLTATLDEEHVATLSWEAPWIDPVDRVRLVTTGEVMPTGPDDGRVLTELEGVAPGSPGRFVDTLPLEPGETRHYAIFAAPTVEDALYDGIAEGDNLAIVSRAPPVEDTGVTDTGTVEPEPEPAEDSGAPEDAASADPGASDPEKGGCGCAMGTASTGGWLGLVLSALVLGRRRDP